MALREYVDPSGTVWQVWNVQPMSREGAPYSGEERRVSPASDYHPDRRRHPPRRAALTPEMQQGWLCFESGQEKRRLTPIPSDWERCADEQVAAYLQQASPVRARPRRVPR
jgi:hypothetical protein